MTKNSGMYTAYEASKKFGIPHSTIKDDISRYNKFEKYIEGGQVVKEDGKWLLPETVIREVYYDRIIAKEAEEAKEFEWIIKDIFKERKFSLVSLYTLARFNNQSLKRRILIPYVVDAYFEDLENGKQGQNIFADFYHSLIGTKRGWMLQVGSESDIARNNILFIELVAERTKGKTFNLSKEHKNSLASMIEDFVLTLESKWETNAELRKMAIPKLEEYREALSQLMPQGKLAMLDMVIEKSKQDSVIKIEYKAEQNEEQIITLPKLTGLKKEDMIKLLSDTYHMFSRKDQKKLVMTAYKKFDSYIFRNTQVEKTYESIALNEIAIKEFQSKAEKSISFKNLRLIDADAADFNFVMGYVNEFTSRLSTEYLERVNSILGTNFSSEEMFNLIDLLNKQYLGISTAEEKSGLIQLLETSENMAKEVNKVGIPTDRFGTFITEEIILTKFEALLGDALGITKGKNFISGLEYGFNIENKEIDFEKTIKHLQLLVEGKPKVLLVLNWHLLLGKIDREKNIFNKIDSKRYLKWISGLDSYDMKTHYLDSAFAAYWKERGYDEILRYAFIELLREQKSVVKSVEESFFGEGSVESYLKRNFGEDVIKTFLIEVVEKEILEWEMHPKKKIEWVLDKKTYYESNQIFKIMSIEKPEILNNAFYLITGKSFGDIENIVYEQYEKIGETHVRAILGLMIDLFELQGDCE